MAAHEQATACLQIAQTLKRFAHELNLTVVVMNQVGSVYTTDDVYSTATRSSSKSTTTTTDEQHIIGGDAYHHNVKAALGAAWYHCVSTRILLEQSIATATASTITKTDARQQRQQQDVVHRTATVVKSSMIQTPGPSVRFTITTQGLVEEQQNNHH